MKTNEKSKTIVLIPGLWLTALSWEHWVERYRARGFNVIAKSWPGMERDVSSLRADHAAIDSLGIAEVVDHYESIVRELPEKPIIMGHSMGGVVVQILLDRGHGSAGVLQSTRARSKACSACHCRLCARPFPRSRSPANNHRSVMLTPDQFHYAFTNTLAAEESSRMYERYAVPGPGRVLFQAALANFNPNAATKVDFHNAERAPLLLIAGGADHTAPPAVTRAEAKLQGKSSALTAYKEFPGPLAFHDRTAGLGGGRRLSRSPGARTLSSSTASRDRRPGRPRRRRAHRGKHGASLPSRRRGRPGPLRSPSNSATRASRALGGEELRPKPALRPPPGGQADVSSSASTEWVTCRPSARSFAAHGLPRDTQDPSRISMIAAGVLEQRA